MHPSPSSSPRQNEDGVRGWKLDDMSGRVVKPLVTSGMSAARQASKFSREGWVMRLFSGFLLVVGLVSIALGSETKSDDQAKEDPVMVNFAYAPEKIRQGDIWKVYLSVTDSDGRMQRVVCQVRQPGGTNAYKPSTIYLKKGMEKQFTGHFALYTNAPTELDDLVLELSILDRAGNERKTLRFPLEFDRSAGAKKPLPQDMEKDLNRRIGIIDIDWTLGGN